MITEVFPIELNGVKYRIAEDMEQASYVLHRQPLRAPVNGFIQGEQGRFQLRPDILEWSISDWSGGEGARFFDSEESARYWVGFDVDPFTQYGALSLARKIETTLNSASATFARSVALAAAGETLYGIYRDSAESGAVKGLVEWSPTVERWETNRTNASQTGEGWLGVLGTGGLVYYSSSEAKIWRYDTTAVAFAEAVSGQETRYAMAGPVLGKYFFANLFSGSAQFGVEVREVSTTAVLPASSTSLFSDVFASSGAAGVLADHPPRMAAGPNAAYLMYNSRKNECVIVRITPTTAAGAGFGEEILRLKGFTGEAVVWLLGFLYVIGRLDEETIIISVDEFNEDFEVILNLGPRRTTPSIGAGLEFGWSVATEGHEPFRALFEHASGPNADDRSVIVIDGVKRAAAGTSVFSFDTGNGDVPFHGSTAFFQGELFIALSSNISSVTTSRVFRQLKDEYTSNTGIMETSINDFDIAEDKILLSLHLETEPLPANTSVVVKYQLNQDGTWLTAGTHDTDNSSVATFTISTGAQTRSFRDLQLRLELASTTSTATPVVKKLAARATVVKGVRVWDLLLDATDEDAQLQDRSWNGKVLMDNIASAGDSGNVVTLKDGYRNKIQATPSEYNVVVDEYRIIQDRPGEGYVSVRLREVTSV